MKAPWKTLLERWKQRHASNRVDDADIWERFLAAWREQQRDEVLNLLAEDVTVALEPSGPLKISQAYDRNRVLVRSLGAIGATPIAIESVDGKVSSITFSVMPEQAANLYLAMMNPWAAGAVTSSGPPNKKDAFPPWLERVGSALLAGLPAAVTLVGLLYLLFPELQPDEPPSVLGASLTDVQLEERRTASIPEGYCAYPEGIDVVQSDRPLVNLVSFDVEFVGYEDDSAIIKWAPFEATSRNRISPVGENSGQQVLNDGPVIRPEAPNDRAAGQLCVPVPARAQCQFVRVYVYEEDGRTRLDYADTPVFFTGLVDDGRCVDTGMLSTPAV